ncbi:SMP-30/gluconolactonase/LRE family protein [Ochrovirga pacifica]|uniref:SMP-30/gluconolactonase/LRE family protein n=1 Tax=Ochrovirga pacifica TaxID=1042376 RepID=UPI000526EC7F|nr:SMP-30/gluconolactonase/LRE family protein [Ochrovirga pacifica]
MRKFFVPVIGAFLMLSTANAQSNVPTSTYVALPDFCPTPDAYDIAPDGSLTLSCPNFAEKNIPGAIVKITANKKVKLLTTLAGINNKGKGTPMGIAYGADGGLYVCANQGKNRGRILKLTFKNDVLVKTEVVAKGLQAPNGIRYYKGVLYVTQPKLDKLSTKGKNVGGLYRFLSTDREVLVQNDKSDTQLIFSVATQNPNRPFGLDGLALNSKGVLFVGDFGDAIIYKLTQDGNGAVTQHSVYVDLPDTVGADGIFFDANDNLYVAGLLSNQVVRVAADRTVKVLAKFDDNDGSNGQIDQPSDLIVYKGKLIISNFDLMTGPGIINTKHSKPYTLTQLDLP